MSDEIHPCIDCIVLAACKNKPLLILVRTCEYLNKYLYSINEGGSYLEKFMITKKFLRINF